MATDAPVTTQKCRYCEETLPFDKFPVDAKTRSGYATKCRECGQAYRRGRRYANHHYSRGAAGR